MFWPIIHVESMPMTDDQTLVGVWIFFDAPFAVRKYSLTTDAQKYHGVENF